PAYLRVIWRDERCVPAPRTAAIADAADHPAIRRLAPDWERRGSKNGACPEHDEHEPNRFPDREQVQHRADEDGDCADSQLDPRQPEGDWLVADRVLRDLDEAAVVHDSVRSGPGPDSAAGIRANGSRNISNAQPLASPSRSFVSLMVGGLPSAPMWP